MRLPTDNATPSPRLTPIGKQPMREPIDSRIELGIGDLAKPSRAAILSGNFQALRRKPSPINMGILVPMVLYSSASQ